MHMRGDSGGDLAHGGGATQQADLKAGRRLVVHHRVQPVHIRVAEREAKITFTAIVRWRVQTLGQRAPDFDRRGSERQFRRVAAGLANAGKRPTGCHGRGGVAIEQHDVQASNRQFIGGRRSTDPRAYDHHIGHIGSSTILHYRRLDMKRAHRLPGITITSRRNSILEGERRMERDLFARDCNIDALLPATLRLSVTIASAQLQHRI